jgi:hypothetical protein
MMICWIALPAVMYGIFAGSKLLDEIIKVRKGYFKVYLTESNHRRKGIMSKPSETEFKINDVSYPFTYLPGFITYEGRTPCVSYDVNKVQINFSNSPEKVRDGNLDKLLIRVFNEGKIQGFGDINAIKIFIVVVGLIALISAAIGYMTYQDLQAVADSIAAAGVLK